ncbi:MAG: oxygen-independent coproporphyrinogen III oxidase [Bacteroidales bacterium]|nr:oxygen-independent coproporphyrinogen III oxidase [Bacteroidales bacterium]
MSRLKELIDKYDVPVPRYTSYPPANSFGDGFSHDDYIEVLRESNSEKPEHIAIYIHIPFCKKLCYYCGCNSCTFRGDAVTAEYMNALREEIKMIATHIDNSRAVTQIHYGGGTPNAIASDYLKELNNLIFSLFTMHPDAEIAIECNPAYLDRQYMDDLKEAGFNRFSLGIQDFNLQVLRNVNREAPVMPVGELMEYLREGNRGAAVNLDFIYGLPGQTPASFSDTISEAIGLRPDRLVTFSYAHVPWLKKNQLFLEKLGLPAPEEKVDMFLAAHDLMKGAGYKAIGLDHYVLPGDELWVALQENMLHRNFMGYCTRRTTGQVYAFGVSGISQTASAYVQNLKEINGYIDAIKAGRLPVEKGLRLTNEQKVIREVITQFMCNGELKWSEMAEQMKMTTDQLRGYLRNDTAAMDQFLSDQLIERGDDFIRVTGEGSLFIRNIAASMDPAYNAETNRYSKSL